MSDYVIILHVGTNDAIDYEDYEASEIVKKILLVKELIYLRVPNCKVSKPIKRHDNDNVL